MVPLPRFKSSMRSPSTPVVFRSGQERKRLGLEAGRETACGRYPEFRTREAPGKRNAGYHSPGADGSARLYAGRSLAEALLEFRARGADA